MIAPSATIVRDDFMSGDTVNLAAGRFNVLNLSYGWVDVGGMDVGSLTFDPQESSIISYGSSGAAFISKSAGNSSTAAGQIAVGAIDHDGNQDYLGAALIGGQSVVFVGALSTNGTTSNQASMAGYSNIAGSDLTVQGQFLVVGVESGTTGLAGTSLAAPIVSGYAAVLSSKFDTASATTIANRLLDTARTDTIASYSAGVHGQGEACITCALAPLAIN